MTEKQQAQAIVKRFYGAIDKKATGVMFKQQLGLALALLKTYTYEEIMKVLDHIEDTKNAVNMYSIGFLHYKMNELLDEVALKDMKSESKESDVLKLNVDNEVARGSSFFDKFM